MEPHLFPERMAANGVVGLLDCERRMENQTERGNHAMWISLFTFASGAAVCLSVAAVMMQPTGQRTLRG
jgi:hypothetical protein